MVAGGLCIGIRVPFAAPDSSSEAQNAVKESETDLAPH